MTTFGDLKNNIEILKKYLSKMNITTQSEIKPILISEDFLKKNNPKIFLELLHYIMIEFSPSVVFIKVLDYYPTIKNDNDQKFIENVINLGRKIFDVDLKLDAQQFLSKKYLQKKTQFASLISKLAYELHTKSDKSSGVFNNNGFKSSKMEIPSSLEHKYISDGNDQEEGPRTFNIIPSNSRNIEKVIQKNESQQSDEQMKQLRKNKKNFKQKQLLNKNLKNFEETRDQGNVKKQVKNKKFTAFEQDGQQQANYQNRKTIHKKVINQVNKANDKQIYRQQGSLIDRLQNEQKSNWIEDKGENYISRQQFMQIMVGINNNFSELLGKFNSFQSQVSGWVQNVNAKISILEQNVKTIKNNL